MFDDDEKADLQSAQIRPASQRQAPFNWKTLTVPELIRYRDEITACLPPLNLKEMNLEEEMLLQFHNLRALQASVLENEEEPLNQRVQVNNSLQGVINKLLEQQEATYTQERFKRVENLLIQSLNKLPEGVAAEFLEQYEKLLKAR